MGFRRKFNGEPVNRLIVSVPVVVVDEIDQRMKASRHPARRNRSEFVRLAILEKLERDMDK